MTKKMEFVSDDFEDEIYMSAAKAMELLRDVMKRYQDKEKIDDKKATLTLMWYIRTFIIIAWKEPMVQQNLKVSDVLENIKEVVKAQGE